MKLDDSKKYKEKKEKDKLRKRAERERKKLELEALRTPSTPQTTIARASSESSAFRYRSTKQIYVKKVEKYLPKSPGKRREVLYESTNKFCVRFDFKAKREKTKTNLVMRN